MQEIDLLNNENIIIINEIRDNKIIGSRIKSDEIIEVNASKEYLNDLKILLNENEIILIAFNSETMRVIEADK